MAEITVELGNDNDFPPEDLERLERELRQVDGSLTLSHVAREQVGRSVTWWEVTYIWLGDQVGGALVGSIVTVLIQWARSRFKGGRGRPKYIELYGPDGKLLKAVLMKSADGELEDHSDQAHAHPRHPRASDKPDM